MEKAKEKSEKIKFNFNNFINQRAGCYAIIILICLISFFIFKNWNIIEANDARLHYQKFLLTKKTIVQGGGFGRMIYVSYGGAGNAGNFLYAPFSTYAIVGIDFILNNIISSVDVFTMFMSILAGISMFELTREITKNNKISLFAGLLYMTCPYRLQNIYARFAVGEYTAMSFSPLVFLGLYNVFHGDKKKGYFIGIGAIGVFLSHTLTLEIIAALSLIYVICNFKKINKEIILLGVKNVIMILLMTCIFWAPLIEYKTFGNYGIFNSNTMTNGLKIADEACDLSQLIATKPNAVMNLEVGILQLIFCLFSVILFKKIKDKDYNKTYIFYLISCIFFMIASTKIFPWKYMPGFIKMIQYPWRLIGIVEIFISVIAAINVFELVNLFLDKLKEEKNLKEIKQETMIKIENITLIILIVLNIFSTMYYHNRTLGAIRKYNSESEYTEYLIRSNMSDFLSKVDKVENLNLMMTNREYMPQKGIDNSKKLTYVSKRDNKIAVLSGNIEIQNETKNNLSVKADLYNVEAGSSIELPLNYYPGYKIDLLYKDEQNNVIKKVRVNNYNESDIGYIKIDFDEKVDNVEINVRYDETNLEKISVAISGITLILWIGYTIYMNKFYIKSKNV